MANGIPCKRCGRQESDHIERDHLPPEEYKKVLEGYRTSLKSCLHADYKPEKQKRK